MLEKEIEDYNSPFTELDKGWEKLSSSEKDACLVYAESLIRNNVPDYKLIKLVNDIHAKYPEFHMGCVPFSL